MKNTPLLMIENMVSKTLEDLKTMTRRLVSDNVLKKAADGFIVGDEKSDEWAAWCPYGQPGDRLWIKETHYRYGKWIKNGISKTGRQKWKFKPLSKEIKYFDTMPDMLATGRRQGWHKRPSIFMPKWATRLWLEITDIRVERLQDISIDDIDAEGFMPCSETYRATKGNQEQHKLDFGLRLWDSINAERNGGAYAWDKNPWVWVITFRRCR